MLKKIKGLILFGVISFVAAWNYRSLWLAFSFLLHVLMPFILGGAIAFILNVPMSFIEKKWCRKRAVSIIFTLLGVFGILILVCYIVIPELGKTIMYLGENLRLLIPKIEKWTGALPDWDEIGIFDSTYQAAKSIVSGVVTFVIAFVFACYILSQKERLYIQLKKVMYAFLPRDWSEIFLALFSLTSETFSHFLTGQFLEALILGGMFLGALLILRIPYALLISIVIVVTALIPVVGAFIGCALGTVLVFTAMPGKAILFVVLFLILQQVEGNLIYPRIVGNSVGLPSIWVLFAVGVGAGLWGIVGVIVFIPISAVVYSMTKGIVHRRLKERGISIE